LQGEDKSGMQFFKVFFLNLKQKKSAKPQGEKKGGRRSFLTA
jgi:hypothetical protein